MSREFKYYPEDFGDLVVDVIHMDLDFDVYDDHTVVETRLHFSSRIQDLVTLDLNAKNLEIITVSEDYEYLKDKDILRLKLKNPLKKGENFTVETKVITRPTWNVLEGLYYDITPKGCPCTQITQCQQWGFQRLTPCIDDMTAKCTYTTRIRADERYTNYLSNGDVLKHVSKISDNRVEIIYSNEVTPMATYLFFLGVGTYLTVRKEFMYPNGKTFDLELLVPKDSDQNIAEYALEVLWDSILWVYLFTGPFKYENHDLSTQIYNLCIQRRKLEKDSDEFVNKSKEIEALLESSDTEFGYEYTGTVYREIGMQNSDFGGMENVGNTTITTNRIMPHKEMLDGSFEYMVKVKVHEYYHNLNGSEVTGRSPFEIWLNEAVTVFIEQEYSKFVFGEDYERLDTLIGVLSPAAGTFVMDDAKSSMPIEPVGFNDTNELITGVTYVKAPEYVKMIETILGRENFVRALDSYHTEYKHSNASSSQWIDCMQDFTDVDLHDFSKKWLKDTGYPKVSGEYSLDSGSFLFKLRQSNASEDDFWKFPLKIALFDSSGNKFFEHEYFVFEPNFEIEIQDVNDLGFVSINRDLSFFGKVIFDRSLDELYLQSKFDDDICARFTAVMEIFDIEKTQVLNGGNFSDRFLDFYWSIMSDISLVQNLGTMLLTNFEHVNDSKFTYSFDKLYLVNKDLKKALFNRFESKVLDLYNHVLELESQIDNVDYAYSEIKLIKLRQLKNLCLSILISTNNDHYLELVVDQYFNSISATDRLAAFNMIINSDYKKKVDVFEHRMSFAKTDLVAWESFLQSVSGSNSDEIISLLNRIENSDSFNLSQANDQRGLFVRFAFNRKKSLLTEEGRKYLFDKIIQLAQVNEYSTGRMLMVFNCLEHLDDKIKISLIKGLNKVIDSLDNQKYPSVCNTIKRLLA